MVLGLKGAVAEREGPAAIAPIVETRSQAFGDLARALDRNQLGACDRAGGEPDTALVQRVAQALSMPEAGPRRRWCVARVSGGRSQLAGSALGGGRHPFPGLPAVIGCEKNPCLQNVCSHVARCFPKLAFLHRYRPAGKAVLPAQLKFQELGWDEKAPGRANGRDYNRTSQHRETA
jgi:hypothetical protein